MDERELENLLCEAREGSPSADELKSLEQVLRRRLRAMQEELATLPKDAPERPDLQRRVARLKRQVSALAEEAAISAFVEESALATLRQSRLREA